MNNHLKTSFSECYLEGKITQKIIFSIICFELFSISSILSCLIINN